MTPCSGCYEPSRGSRRGAGQARPRPRQHQRRIHRQSLAGGYLHIQQHRGGGQLEGAQLGVGDAGAIRGDHALQANAADDGILMLEMSDI
jgi:hypothetical protein